MENRRLRMEREILKRASRGDCWDNAVVESFFGTALLYPRPWPTRAALYPALAHYLVLYNGRRLHSSLDYRSPIEFETLATQTACVAA
jgi:putative transposase